MGDSEIREHSVHLLGAAVPWFQELLRAHSIELSASSELAQALEILEKTRLGAEIGATLRFGSPAAGQQFHLRATGADFLSKALHRGFSSGLHGFHGHLQELRSSDPILTGPSGSSTTARNGTWELLLASLVSPFASNVRRAEPDILMEFEGATVGLAAKVLYSKSTATRADTVVLGADQLEKSVAEYGFVVVNLVELFPHAEMFRNFVQGDVRDPGAAENILTVWMTTFIELHNLGAWGRRLASRSKVLSVLFFLPTVVHFQGREVPIMPYYRVHVLARPGQEDRARAFESALNDSCQRVLGHDPRIPTG
jgi:hypothetical protein